MSEIITAAEYRARSSKRNKYGNDHKAKVGTEKFASRREALRHIVLKDMEKHGEIINLTRQPRFKLKVNGKLICTYVGDWSYQRRTCLNGFNHVFANPPAYGSIVVEDSKGYQTAEFKIKFKLAKALYPEIDWRIS